MRRGARSLAAFSYSTPEGAPGRFPCCFSGVLLTCLGFPTLNLPFGGSGSEVRPMETQKVPEPGARDQRARRPYEPPAVSWEEDFLPYVYSTCNKMPGQAGCGAHSSS